MKGITVYRARDLYSDETDWLYFDVICFDSEQPYKSPCSQMWYTFALNRTKNYDFRRNNIVHIF